MPTVYDIDNFFGNWAQKENSETWDNDGIMLCADTSATVKKVTVCLEINEKTARDAAANGADLIITHHPYIFRPLKRICGNDYSTAEILINNRISVLSYHTRLDAADGGVNDVLAEKLGLCDVVPFIAESKPLGRVGRLEKPVTAEDFAVHIKNVLGVESMRCAISDRKKIIKTVAVVGGGGKDFVEKAAELADAYVTADLSHNSFITANELGICVFDAGHYHTENPVTHMIAEKLGKAFPELEISISDSLCPYVIM